MYTPEQIETIVVDYLKILETNGAIAGKVTRQDEREASTDEDITVGVLTSTDGYVSRATLMVRTYIKDVGYESETEYKYKPNTYRFDMIISNIIGLLGGERGVFWSYGNLWISNPSAPKYKNELGEHVQAIRVEMKLHESAN